MKHLPLYLFTPILVTLAITTSVFALPSQASNAGSHTTTPVAGQGTKGAPAAVQTKLDAIKLQACQRVETAIQNRSAGMAKGADKLLGVLSTLQTRVEARYSKEVSAGITVPNYSNLLALANTAKANAVSAIATAKNDDTFSCSSINPHGQLNSFKDSMIASKQSLHDYLIAIKNLNVAISTAKGQSVASSSASPKPATGSANSGGAQ